MNNLTMTQILSDVWFFYKQNFLALIRYIIPVSLLISLLGMGLSDWLSGGDEDKKLSLLFLFNFMFQPLYIGGLILLLSALSQDREPGIGQLLSLAVNKWLALLLLSMLSGALVLLGLFMFVFPGIWIFMRLVIGNFLLILDDLNPVDALTESFQLTAPQFWNITGTTLLIFLSIVLFQQYLMKLLPDTMIASLLSGLVGEILWAVLIILWFRFYDLVKNNR